jgi:tetratricopeptide (TPR) repeat protein
MSEALKILKVFTDLEKEIGLLGALALLIIIALITMGLVLLWKYWSRRIEKKADLDSTKTPPVIPKEKPATPNLIGRTEEVKALCELLSSGGGHAAICAVNGQGGIGKTTLAWHVIEEIREKFPGGIIPIDMKGTDEKPLSANQAMATILTVIDPALKPPDDEATLKALYQNQLAGKHCLLLLDNAKNGEQIKGLTPPSPNALLVTSRQKINLAGGKLVNLDLLLRPAAKELLQSTAENRQFSDEELEQIAIACGDLPIALIAAGSQLAIRGDLTVADYLKQLGDERTRLAALTADGHDVLANLSLSLRMLERENSTLAQQWRKLGVFPADFAAPAAAAVWGIEEKEAEKILSDLLLQNLLTPSEEKRYRLHDLYRDLARLSWSDEEKAEAGERHALYFMSVLEEANQLYMSGHANVLLGLQLFDRERVNIESGFAWAKATKNPAHQGLAFDYYNAGAHVLGLRFTPRQRIEWLEAALAAARVSNHRLGEGYALGNLGIAYWNLGEYKKAIGYHEQRLVIAREIGDRQGEGNALGNLGLAYYGLGEYEKAIGYYEQRLVIAHEIGDRRGEGNALGNLGLAYYGLGEYKKAIGYYEQALIISREIGDRRGEGNDLWNMADTLKKMQKHEEAITHAEASLKIRDSIGDPNAAQVRAWLAEWRSEG